MVRVCSHGIYKLGRLSLALFERTKDYKMNCAEATGEENPVPPGSALNGLPSHCGASEPLTTGVERKTLEALDQLSELLLPGTERGLPGS